jgi:DNA repair protein RecN (Recombination protein N)
LPETLAKTTLFEGMFERVLTEMLISGLGVIDEASIEPDPGFTVVTGETGAGKTMVVTGLHLLSGGRAEASRVRAGAKKAVVEGRFAVPPDSAALDVAADAGGDADEDGSLIVLRSVGEDGRSRAHLGGRSAPVGMLSDLSDSLLAVHGQNDQLRLQRPAEQRGMLDRFAGRPVADRLKRYRELRAEWMSVSEELTQRAERARELAREADLLRHGLEEIAAVDPGPGEDVELQTLARRLADADQLRDSAVQAQHALSGADDGDPDVPGALGLVDTARKSLAGTDDEQLRQLVSRLDEAAVLLTDVGAELSGYLESLSADPERLQEILARQADLKALTRKYAADTDGVLAWAAEATDRLASLDTSDEAIAELRNRRDALATELAGEAKKLSDARRASAGELAAAVTEELTALAMPHAVLHVEVVQRQVSDTADLALRCGKQWVHAGVDGVDEVELRLRPHPGSEPLPIGKGASGGELSRVMLALEVVLAHANPVPTLVFDEVDAGVGGRAAVEVGKRLARLASSHQVIVVTHLPQVAAFADRHLVVDKDSGGGVTRSGIRTLAEGDRVEELSRMLAGMDSTDTGRAHAEELLELARHEKSGEHPADITTKKSVKRRTRRTDVTKATDGAARPPQAKKAPSRPNTRQANGSARATTEVA